MLEEIWDSILSRNPKQIISAYSTLSSNNQKTVYQHLVKMVSEEGWHPEQVISAKSALDVLSHYNQDDLHSQE